MSDMNDDNEVVDIKKQLTLAIKALRAIQPFAEEADIPTAPEKAYDEWDAIVQGIYDGFLVIPLCETDISLIKDQFKKVGFTARAGDIVIVTEDDGFEYYLDDIRSDQNGIISSYFRIKNSDAEAGDVNKNIEHLKELRVSKI